MKKILISDALKPIIESDKSILNRDEVKLFIVSTNDEMLAVHREEKADLIISKLDMPGMPSEELYSEIRENDALKRVSLILVSQDRPEDVERCRACRPNAIMTLPFGLTQLMQKMQQLLDVSWRESYRVLLSVNVDGSDRGRSFFCRSENISASGLLIETDRELSRGDQVACSFFLPGSRQIKVAGEVVRVMKKTPESKSSRYGLRFVSLAADERAAIEDFVNRKYQMHSEAG